MPRDCKIDYVEFPAQVLGMTTSFYSRVFGWRFTDYGTSYSAFDEGIEGGFQGDPKERKEKPLIVIYAQDLEAVEAKVRASGGQVIKPIFPFPGGRRFHFLDPSGNELAVWSDR